MRIAFWGSSLVSAYWNGAATYYRGILRALAQEGYVITFFEPDAYDRQKHRDIPDPDWATIIVYDPSDLAAVRKHLAVATDVIVKASGVGVLDEYLESAISQLSGPRIKIFWDVDAPATLDRLQADPSDSFHGALPNFDLVLTYGGGDRVASTYRVSGARECAVIYNAFDPDVHFPVAPDTRFLGDISFLGNRLPDREARVEEYFLRAAALAPDKLFLLGGSGWGDKWMPTNVRYAGHIYTRDHNAFNCSARAVLNISRNSMAAYGFSPATRVFEAAGAGACIVSDDWDGLPTFLIPETEILVVRHAEDVVNIAKTLPEERARTIGSAAQHRVLNEHTYERRGKLVDSILRDSFKSKERSHAGAEHTMEMPA